MKLALTGRQKKQLNHKISVEIYSIIQISTQIQFELTICEEFVAKGINMGAALYGCCSDDIYGLSAF